MKPNNGAKSVGGGKEIMPDRNSMSDDRLQSLGRNLQQASNPPGLSLTKDTSYLKRLTL